MQQRRMLSSLVLKIIVALTFLPFAHLFKLPARMQFRSLSFLSEEITQNLQDMTRVYSATKQAVTGADNEEFYAQMIDFSSEDYYDEDEDDDGNMKFIEGAPRSPKEINE